MANDTALSAIGRRPSVLDRSSLSSAAPLSEVQSLTDNLTSTFLQEATSLRTAAAMLGAGWVGRVTRIGALGSLPGQALLPQVVRYASHVPALAAESAAFAGIERGFHSLQGHPTSRPFHEDWARAAVTLGGLKAFSAFGSGQNLILQHLTTDLGLVGSQHAAAAMGLIERPRGTLAQQMLTAEATNLQMMGSLALAHGLSPRLSASERSLDVYLRSQVGGLRLPSLPVSEGLATAMAGSSGAPAPEAPGSGLRDLTVYSISSPLGGGGGRARREMSTGDLAKIYRGDEPPADGHSVMELVQRHDLVEHLNDGKIIVGLQDTTSSNLPTTYDILQLKVNPQQVFRTLLNINGTGAWMPRLEYFRVAGDDAMDYNALQRAMDSSRLPVTQSAQGRFLAGSILARPLVFQGRFLFTFRNIPGGSQMSWELRGPQDFTETDAKKMDVCSSSFTVVPFPNRPEWTLLAHSLHVEPQSMLLRAGLRVFFPGAHKNELPQFMTALSNRAMVPSWTSKDKDPFGIELHRVTNPSNANYSLIEL